MLFSCKVIYGAFVCGQEWVYHMHAKVLRKFGARHSNASVLDLLLDLLTLDSDLAYFTNDLGRMTV